MLTKSFTSLRRMSAYVLTLLLVCAAFSQGANAQANPPAVTASFATTVAAPSGFGGVLQTALDNYGNWIIPDWVNGALYEVPAGGGAVITLAAPGVMGGVGGYQNPGITFDSQNNLYIAGNFNNCLLLFPYDPGSKTWPGLATLTTTNQGPSQCGAAPFSFAQYNLITPPADQTGLGVNYIQPWGLAMLPNNVLVIGSQDGGNFIFTLPVLYPGPATCSNGNCSPTATPGTDNATAGTVILDQMTKRPNTVAADKFGNIYFTEDSGGLAGAYMIPAGLSDLFTDADPRIVRVDPNLANVDGVATDANGNVYVSDSKAGVFMIPNPSGTPDTAAAVNVTTLPATAGVSVDLTRSLVYVPTSGNGLAVVSINTAELGSTAAGAPAATSPSVMLYFNSAVSATPVIEEAGTATPDFIIPQTGGGTCAGQTSWAAGSSCTVNVTLDPHAAGSVAAELEILSPTQSVLGSILLHGTGVGSAVNVLPGGQSAIGSGLQTPSQVAVDAAGNTYVADAGLDQVLMYPKGASGSTAGVPVGTGWTTPTGVAVDGAGDVFVADSGSGTVVEVPLEATGLNPADQMTLKSGLGSNLRLAIDGSGNVYVSDPDNQRVVKLWNFNRGTTGVLAQAENDITGFPSLTAIGVDSSDNLYVANGSNLIEVTPSGTQSTVVTGVSGVAGLSVDASGAVYAAEPGGVVRIPDESGTLNLSDATMLATVVTNPTSVALDAWENLYIVDGTAEDVDLVSSSASTNFGTQSTPTSAVPPADYTIFDSGNSALNISGFANTADFSETATSCTGPVSVGGSCTAEVTFAPGPGDQGTLTGEVLITSDAANSPVGINAVGVGAALAASTTNITVNNPTVDNTTAVITVTPASGTTPTPTGNVTLTVSGAGLATPLVLPEVLGSDGTVTVLLPEIPAGTYTFAVSYQGDRVYSGSTITVSVGIAAGAVMLVQPTLDQVQAVDSDYPYILSGGQGSQEPYDGTVNNIEYTYPVSVVTTDGSPLIGLPIYDPVTGALLQMNYGEVSFEVNGTIPSGCAAVPVAADGTANFNTSCLPIDTSNTTIPDILNAYTVTPVYSPADVTAGQPANPNYTSFTGTSINFTALRNPMVSITSNPASLTISAGSSASTTLTLTSVLGYGFAGANAQLNNYALPLELACDGLPAYATCSFTYPPPPAPSTWDPNPDANAVYVTPVGTPTPDGLSVGPGTVVMTITTNIPTGTSASLHSGPVETMFAAVFGLGLLGMTFRRKRALMARLAAMACVMVCIGVVAGVSGCSTKQLGTSSSDTKTPTGTYKVIVTAKQAGSAYIKATSPGGTSYNVSGNQNQMSLPFTINVTIQ